MLAQHGRDRLRQRAEIDGLYPIAADNARHLDDGVRRKVVDGSVVGHVHAIERVLVAQKRLDDVDDQLRSSGWLRSCRQGI